MQINKIKQYTNYLIKENNALFWLLAHIFSSINFLALYLPKQLNKASRKGYSCTIVKVMGKPVLPNFTEANKRLTLYSCTLRMQQKNYGIHEL